VGKRRSNSQYFKGKKLQREIFNQLNIKKVKSTKIILKKKDKQKKGESWKKKVILEKKKRGNLEKKNEKVIKKRNALWITIIIHNALGVGEQ
jgi:hypothetical protein